MKAKWLVVLLIAALLVVYYLFGTDYLKQRPEQAVLTSQVAEVTQLRAQMPGTAQDLEQRLASARADLAAAQSAFPADINSTRAINTILKLAEESHVKAVPLITEPWSKVKAGQHTYRVFRVTIAAEGNYSQLAGFINKLESGELMTLVLGDLSITRVEEENGEPAFPEGDVPVVANLRLAIYAWPAAND